MKKTSDDIRILTTEEVEKYFVVSKIHKCNECGNLPQVIEKIQQLKYYTEKKYKCYCPNCKKRAWIFWKLAKHIEELE